MARLQPVSGGPDRRWTLSLPPVEAAIVLSLPDQLSALLADPERNRRVIDRLFPTSYDDAQQEREHRELLGSSLLQSRREMVTAVRAAFAAASRSRRGLRIALDEPGVDLLLRFVNDTRLVLATELGLERNLSDVVVDPASPDAPKYTLLVYLGGLESLLVEALIGDPGF